MKKRKILIVLLTVLAVVIVGGAALYLKLSQNLAQLEALTITEVDLSRAADGDYTEVIPLSRFPPKSVWASLIIGSPPSSWSHMTMARASRPR